MDVVKHLLHCWKTSQRSSHHRVVQLRRNDYWSGSTQWLNVIGIGSDILIILGPVICIATDAVFYDLIIEGHDLSGLRN